MSAVITIPDLTAFGIDFIDIFSGLRESEIIGLTWDCVDFDKGIITVAKQLKRERKIIRAIL